MLNLFKKDRQTTSILSADSSIEKLESYKSLRLQILHLLADTEGSSGKVIAITGIDTLSSAGMNLAISFGQLGKKVLLIEADLKEPVLNQIFKSAGEPGLTDVIKGSIGLAQALKMQEKEGISFLPSGARVGDSSLIFSAPGMKDLIDSARQTFDYIFINLPSAASDSDAAVIGGMTDGYLLFVRHKVTRKKELEKAIRLLERTDGRILGIVYLQ